MDLPKPNPAARPQHPASREVPLDTWVRLREELSELNARLQYLRLMARLGMRRIE